MGLCGLGYRFQLCICIKENEFVIVPGLGERFQLCT